MNSIEDEDRLKKIIKYSKYVLLLLILVGIILVLKGCGQSYSKIEDAMVDAAKKYVQGNNISVKDEIYIEISSFDIIEGTELCKNGSGVIVTNENGSLKFQPYLDCYPDYNTKIVNNKGKYITLSGDEVVVLNEGEVFVDKYYTITGELLNGYVDIRGEVKTTPGIYSVYYDVYYPTDDGNSSEDVENFKLVETLIRKVIVIKSDKNMTVSGLKNTEEPYLKLYGETNMTLSKGAKYVEPSYIAYDYVDGKISRQVKVSGEVNTGKIGNYVISYTVTNSRGRTVMATRNIQVVSQSADLTVNINKNFKDNKVVVEVEIIGNGYDHSETLKGIEHSRHYSFEVDRNQNYPLRIYDTYGNMQIKNIDITEIDDIKPFGSCKAVTMYNKTNISVEATDNKGIAAFNYKLNNKESGFIQERAYEFDEKASSVSVIIKDVSDNTTTVNCTIEEGSKLYVNEKGYNCLYPFTCFKQGDYSDWRYSFCSTETCGRISQRGCSITSVTTVVSGFGVKDKNGELYTPYTMLSEIYDPIACKYKSKCSGSTSSYRAFTHLGLNVTMNEKGGNAYYFSRDQIPRILNHLKNGGAVLIRVNGPGIYAVSKGHIMALLGVNEKDEVYLFDPNAKYGETNGKGPVNTFISTEYLVKGQVTWFQLVSK